MKNVKYGKCVKCGKVYEAVPGLTNCECGGILDIVYDYDYIKTQLTKEKLAARSDFSMPRWFSVSRARSVRIGVSSIGIFVIPFR